MAMARDFKRKKKLAVISELNVTPLIDLAFSLLIIFMITTPVIEQYNRINLPDQDASPKQSPPKLMINLLPFRRMDLITGGMNLFRPES